MNTERSTYLSRIGSRASFLYACGALQGNVSLVREGSHPQASQLCSALSRWGLRTTQLASLRRNVLDGALRQPGRRFERFVSLQEGRPRGSVHWPRTIARRLGQEEYGQLEFVCRSGRRSLVAPENTLLVLWLESILENASGLVNWLARSDFAGPDERRFLASFRRQAGEVLKLSAFRESRAEAARVRSRGQAGLAELRDAVRHRAFGHPPAAPAWARALLGVGATKSGLPLAFVRAEIESELLWLLMAQLDAIALARHAWPLRQLVPDDTVDNVSIDHMRFGHRGLVLRPVSTINGWVLYRDGRAQVGLSVLPDESWARVRTQALADLWDLTVDGSVVDRWLVMHRAPDAPAQAHAVERGTLRLTFVRTNATEAPASLASEALKELAR